MMLRLLALLCLSASPLAAQSVIPCDWQSSAQSLVEPWAQNTKQFANGDVRLALLDTIEPAIGAAYLLVLSPPYDELGGRQCRVVGFSDQMGFAALYFEQLTADYDPAQGLIFNIPAIIGDAASSFTNSAVLTLTLNQSTGAMTTTMALGRE